MWSRFVTPSTSCLTVIEKALKASLLPAQKAVKDMTYPDNTDCWTHLAEYDQHVVTVAGHVLQHQFEQWDSVLPIDAPGISVKERVRRLCFPKYTDHSGRTEM